MLLVVAMPGPMTSLAVFEPNQFLAGSFWQVVTYPFFAKPSIFLILGMYFFYRFGGMVESALSRSRYVRLLLAVMLTPPVVVLLANFLNLNGVLIGSHLPHLAVFVAAISMIPNAQSAFLGIRMKWFAVTFVGIAFLQFLMIQQFGSCLALVAVTYLAVWWMRQAGHVSQWGVVEDVFGPRAQKQRGKKRSQKKRVYEKKIRPRTKVTAPRNKNIDRILDKISEEGLHSLTEEERKLLQEASKK